MKRVIFTLVLIAVIAVGLSAAVVKADYRTDVQTQLKAVAGEKGAEFGTPRDPRLVAAYVIQALLGVLGIIFIVYIVYAGYLIMASAGEEEKVKKGKSIMRSAIIGLIITISAYGISLLAYRIASGDVAHEGSYFEVQQDTSQFYNPDPLSQDTTIW